MPAIADVKEFSKAIDPAVNIVFNGAFKQGGETYKDICEVGRTELYNEEVSSNVSLSMAHLKTEKASVNYESFLQGDNNILTQYEYAIGTQISKHLAMFNRINQVKSLINGVGLAVSRRREFDITKLIDKADSASYTHGEDGSTVIDLTGGDGLALQSASHSTKRSSTSVSNVIGDGTTSNMDLAEDALEAAETVTAPAITDESDQKITYQLSRLFCSRKKSWTAMRLLKTSAGRVGTPNNDINLVQGRYALTVLPYLDNTDYFALKDDMMNSQPGFMMYLESQGLTKEGPHIDFDTKAIKYSWSFMAAAGHNEWRSYLVSKGTNL
jgi:hypothetical protein